MIVQAARHADIGQALHQAVDPARRVGQQADRLALLAQVFQAVDDPRQRPLAVMHHAPKVEDEAVIALCDGGDAGQDGDLGGHQGILLCGAASLASATA